MLMEQGSEDRDLSYADLVHPTDDVDPSGGEEELQRIQHLTAGIAKLKLGGIIIFTLTSMIQKGINAAYSATNT
jgi:hypothetical protein